jgi:AraC-like DNA-binding protein
VLVAICCGMKMKATPLPQFKTGGLREENRAEPFEIWKARKFIHEHSDEELSLIQVANTVGISANHLSEKFKQVTGVNFVRYIARSRYEKACALLHDFDLRVSEIAFATGFQSLSQFNRVFKKLSGKSPTQYRAATRSEMVCRHIGAHRDGAQHRSSILPASANSHSSSRRKSV